MISIVIWTMRETFSSQKSPVAPHHIGHRRNLHPPPPASGWAVTLMHDSRLALYTAYRCAVFDPLLLPGLTSSGRLASSTGGDIGSMMRSTMRFARWDNTNFRQVHASQSAAISLAPSLEVSVALGAGKPCFGSLPLQLEPSSASHRLGLSPPSGRRSMSAGASFSLFSRNPATVFVALPLIMASRKS